MAVVESAKQRTHRLTFVRRLIQKAPLAQHFSIPFFQF